MPHRRSTPSTATCLLLAGLLSTALGAVETVGPGALRDRSAPAPSCPTFHWTADPSAGGFELAVAEILTENESEPTPRRLWVVILPPGSSGWTASGERCLDTGKQYLWSIRPLAPAGESVDDAAAPRWAEARRFEVPVEASDVELAEAVDVLRRYLAVREESAGVGGHSAAPATIPALLLRLPEVAPEAAPTGVAAFSSTYPGASGETYGVYGRSDSSDGRGVVGYGSHVSGLNYGVWGMSESTSGYGVYGKASAALVGAGVRGDGSNRGVWGSSPDQGVFGNALGVSGRAVLGVASSASGITFGVWGQSASTSGRGVYGYASATTGDAIGVLGSTNSISSNAYGVYGIAPGGSAAYAGYFEGGVHVNGNLSKSSGSFKIDHPLDPENQYLYHSFVESPDMMNVYNGNATLDENGAAWVELPEWFEALNRDFRYQLTPLGDWTACWVGQKVTNNRFLVRGGPHAEVSWQVTGIRKDKWAEQHRIEVEVDKSPEERGKYLHPREWGAPAERGLDWNRRQEAARDAERTEPAERGSDAP